MEKPHIYDVTLAHEEAQQPPAMVAGDVPAEIEGLSPVPMKLSSSQEEKEEYEPTEHPLHTFSESVRGVQEVGEAENARGEGDTLEALQREESAGLVYSIYSKRQKQFIIVMTSCAGFFSPLSANIYFPALNSLSADLHVSSSLINLTLTSYMIFQGLAPTLMGDLADMSGRRPAYIIGFIIYIGACVGIALQDSFVALFVLRCLQSTGSSGTIALGSGVVADVSTSAERGTYMGWATSGMLIGPAIGPIIGGVLSQYLGWRAIFWFLVILVGVFLVPFLIAFPETGRNVVGNGSIPPQGWNMSLLNYLALKKAQKHRPALERTTSQQSAKSARDDLAKKRKLKFPNPLGTLKVCLEKDMGLLLFFNAIVYTAFYDVTASIPYLYGEIYGFNDLQIGLSYIPFGVGCFLAPIINGRLLDRAFRRVAQQEGITVDRRKATAMKTFPIERARVPIALPLLLVGDACILIYGWVLEAEVNLAVPLILLFIMGVTLTGAFNVMSVWL